VRGGVLLQDTKMQAGSAPLELPLETVQDARARIDRDGYTELKAEQLQLGVRVRDLALGIVQLMQYGWPPAFIAMYDEAWQLAQEVSLLMKGATGNEINMDMLAWYIDPSKGHAGFSPHRDRQPDDSPSTFRRDGSAKYATIWIPFTDATPDNSCLYVVPRPHDPGYFEGDDDAEDAPDPLSVALNCKQAYQHVRALPATAGSAVIFTHRIIHWGSKGWPDCTEPRISFSFGCADGSYEQAYFCRSHLPFPAHQLRVALVCGQMIVYHERFEFSKSQLSLFNAIFKAQAAAFSPSYQSTVKFELIGSVKDVQSRPAAPSNGGGKYESSDDDSVVEDMMDAMLEAELKGIGDFEDDFVADGDVDDVADIFSDEDGADDSPPARKAVKSAVPQKRHPSLHRSTGATETLTKKRKKKSTGAMKGGGPGKLNTSQHKQNM